MADQKRFEKFRKRMNQIKKTVSFQTYRETVINKILQYAVLNPDADLDGLKEEITKIFGIPFEDFSQELFKRYDDIIDVTNKLYRDLGDDITRDHHQIVSLEKIIKTDLGNYEKRWVDKLSKITRTALADKEVDTPELKRRIFVAGGQISEYADVLAETQMHGYWSEVKNQKALIGEIFWFQYMGDIIKHTRTKCRELLRIKYLSWDQIILLDEQTWRGQLKPFRTYDGGWNCIHAHEPDPFYKPPKK